jgi:hypothetical protein
MLCFSLLSLTVCRERTTAMGTVLNAIQPINLML